MKFNNEYKNYKYAVIKGYKDRNNDDQFSPSCCVFVCNDKVRADVEKKKGTAERSPEEKRLGDSCRVFATSSKKLNVEMIGCIHSKMLRDRSKDIIEDLDWKFRGKSYERDTSLLSSALDKIIRDEKELSFEEVNNFSVDQVTYTKGASESISTYLHTSCWSYSLTGEWKSCLGKVYSLSGWASGEVNRV